jgi:pilus assembly protein Flp/PilA
MAHLYLWIRNCLAREEGQDLAEYALLFALIALVAVGAVTLLGGNVSTVFNNIAAAFNIGP